MIGPSNQLLFTSLEDVNIDLNDVNNQRSDNNNNETDAVDKKKSAAYIKWEKEFDGTSGRDVYN